MFGGNADESKGYARRILEKTRRGRFMLKHLNNVATCLDRPGLMPSPQQEVADFGRNFCLAFEKKASCLNLPTPTPKVIMIMNHAGERYMVYTNNVNLLKLNCFTDVCISNSVQGELVKRGVEAVVNYAEKKECSILFLMSSPWHASYDRSYYEVRSLERTQSETLRGEGRVHDGMMVYTSRSRVARETARTLDVECTDVKLRMEKLDEFKKCFSAACLDVDAETSEALEGSEEQDPQKRIAQLNEYLQMMSQHKKDLVRKIDAMKTEHKEAIQDIKQKADLRVEKNATQATKVKRCDDFKLQVVEEEAQSLKAENSTLVKERERAIAEKNGLEACYDKEREGLLNRARVAEREKKQHAKQMEREMSQLKQAHDAAMESVRASHLESQGLKEKAMQESKSRCLQLEGVLNTELDTRKQMSEHIERLQAEKASVVDQLDQARNDKTQAAMVRMFSKMKVQMMKEELLKAQDEMRLLRLKASESAEKPKAVEKKERGVMARPVRTSEACVQTKEEEQVTRSSAEEGGKPVTVAESESPAESETSVETQGSSAATPTKEPVTGEVVVQEPSPSPAPASAQLDLSTACQGDAMAEALIGNLTSNLKPVLDLARQMSWYKASSDEAWAKLAALQSMQMYQNGGGNWNPAYTNMYYDAYGGGGMQQNAMQQNGHRSGKRAYGRGRGGGA